MSFNYNLNYYFSKKLAEIFAINKYCNVFISPGSRSTPLVQAFSDNPFFETNVIVDERSNAFFALGAARASGIPSILICTSGTAAIEFYPAIAEAFYQHVPLIVLTADRPPYSYKYGVNQAINQEQIYGYHCMDSLNLVPSLDITDQLDKTILSLKKMLLHQQPIHINIHFEKPLEKSLQNIFVKQEAKVDDSFIVRPLYNKNSYNDLEKILLNEHVAMFCGIDNKIDNDLLETFLEKFHLPIFCELSSNIKSSLKEIKYCINNDLQMKVSYIFYFGSHLVSSEYERCLNNYDGKIIYINKTNSIYHPNYKVREDSISVKYGDLNSFLDHFVNKFNQTFENQQTTILGKISESIRIHNNDSKPFTSIDAYYNLSKLLDQKCNIFVSNSQIIRDFNKYFSPNNLTEIYTNRGISGIDGIISTASGICYKTNCPTILIIGDLSFFYDLNALHLINKFKLPLLIILMNNNGGGIFEDLPIKAEFTNFDKYFKTPLNIEFKRIIEGFGLEYQNIENVSNLSIMIETFFLSKLPSVLEIKYSTDDYYKSK